LETQGRKANICEKVARSGVAFHRCKTAGEPKVLARLKWGRPAR
jgi:hypothetical protein